MQKISAKDLYDKLQAEELQLIDVREVDRFTAGHISGAQNLPLSSLAENYGQLINKSLTISSVKGGRSARACNFGSKVYQSIQCQRRSGSFP